MQQNIDVPWIKSELCGNLGRAAPVVILRTKNVRATLVQSVQRLVNNQATNKIFFGVMRLRFRAELIQSHCARLRSKRRQCCKPDEGPDMCKRWLLDTPRDQLGPVVHQGVLENVPS